VQTCRLHRFNRHAFDLFWVRHVEEHRVIRAWLPPVLLNELLALFFEQIDHFLGHGDRLEDRAIVVLFEVEALAVTAVLVLLAAAARTGGVASAPLASHFSLLASHPWCRPGNLCGRRRTAGDGTGL